MGPYSIAMLVYQSVAVLLALGSHQANDKKHKKRSSTMEEHLMKSFDLEQNHHLESQMVRPQNMASSLAEQWNFVQMMMHGMYQETIKHLSILVSTSTIFA